MVRKNNNWEYVEVKSGKARQTPSQKKFENRIKRIGGKYSIVRRDPWVY